MTMEELLKSLGLEKEKIAEITDKMKENKRVSHTRGVIQQGYIISRKSNLLISLRCWKIQFTSYRAGV